MFPARNGGTIELLYTQLYAPTTLAPARDFWTIRYSTTVDNGSFVVCERSLSGSGAGPNAAASPQFVRGEMLPSGYLIRSCDEGGSIIHIVDHLNLEAWSVPEVIRPLYESSKVVAQKMTIAALRYIRQIAQETSGEVVYGLVRQPAVLRTFSQRLSRFLKVAPWVRYHGGYKDLNINIIWPGKDPCFVFCKEKRKKEVTPYVICKGSGRVDCQNYYGKGPSLARSIVLEMLYSELRLVF